MALSVAYVTVQFPEPSETFATNEVRELSRRGASVSVHALRPIHPDAAQLVRDRDLSAIAMTHNSAGAMIRGAWAAVLRPALLLRALGWIVRANINDARDLMVSFLLLPRAFDILALIERCRPDVLHMYWGHYPALVGFLVQHRLPTIVTSMSIVAYDLNREYGGAVDVARRADVVRTHARVNTGHVARFTGVAQSCVNVIYNGVDLASLESIIGGQSRVMHRIVSVGRLIPNKGMGDVLEAFASIRTRWPDATLVVAGEGPERDRLEAMSERLRIGDSVEFLGLVAHTRVVEEMAKAEVFVLLSRSDDERLPNVVKEGMASGCVCITTPTRGIEELVENAGTGFVVPMSDPDAVAVIIDRLFSKQFDGSAMIKSAREHIERNFDLRETAPQYLALWGSAVRAKRVSSSPRAVSRGCSDR